MSAFEDIRALVSTIENSFNLLAKDKDPAVSDDKYEEDLSTAVYEAYAGCLELQDHLKGVCATLRKSYKVKDSEVKAWIKENEAELPVVPEEKQPDPVVMNHVEPAKPTTEQAPKKRGRKPKPKADSPK